MAIDFKRLFNDTGIPHRDDEKRSWIHVNCPFCKNPADTHFNGGFYQLNPHFYCWRCGSHSHYDAVAKVLNISISQVKELFDTYNYISKEKAPVRIARGQNLELPGYHLDDNEKEYLSGRGFDPDYLQSKFHIRGGGTIGEWSYRILIPIYYHDVLVSWTGRSILSKDYQKEHKIPRYKNLSIEQSVINPKEIFFNLDNCDKDSVILVEGPFDVLRMGDDTICSLGTSVTREQELFLKNHFKKVFIAFDNEPAAQEKARHLGMNLNSAGMKVEVVNICEDYYKDIFDDETQEWIKVPKNDPGELTENEVMQIKKELEFL
ncbi:MAG: toprim domain-containing protein [Methanobrevibacter sp.]|nr:toprim domain-containing protein [Methanobrevibacter sp.]